MKLITEILTEISNKPTIAEQSDLLKHYLSGEYKNALETILILMYDWSIEFALPEGQPPYKPLDTPIGTNHTLLVHEYKSLYNFVVGGNSYLNKLKREQLYIDILEHLHKDEAELLIRLFNRKCNVYWNDKPPYAIPFEVVSSICSNIVWFNRGNGKPPTEPASMKFPIPKKMKNPMNPATRAKNKFKTISTNTENVE